MAAATLTEANPEPATETVSATAAKKPSTAVKKKRASRAKTGPMMLPVVEADFTLPSILVDGTTVTFADKAAHIVTIDVATADALLLRNTRNRRINQQNLNKILTDMRNDDYRFTGGSIVMSTTGTLLDGQHRLTGVVTSCVSIEVVLVTGVEPQAQTNMDSGRVRTLPEILRLAGEVNENSLAAAIVGIQSWERGERASDSSTGLTTINTSLEFLDENPVLRDIVREAYSVSQRVQGLTNKQVSQMIWAFDKLDQGDRVDFFAKLMSGAGLEEGNPVLVLRNFLVKDASAPSRVSSHHRAAIVCKAWNAYRAGTTVKSLRFKAGGAKPDVFPEPM